MDCHYDYASQTGAEKLDYFFEDLFERLDT